jgi:CDGSH-type Zn-finger protein
MTRNLELKIVVTRDGPYEVYGPLPLMLQTIVADDEGTSREWQDGRRLTTESNYVLCRCGQSSHKPFCDGTHLTVGFDGTETASLDRYLTQAEELDGPTMALTDAGILCAYARFCDADGSIWAQVEESDDPAKAEMAKKEAARCPSGRLVIWTGEPPAAFEPELEQSIGLVEDPAEGVSGPLWVRGGVLVESQDGMPYEVRNRVTLCRCGASSNKPFCNGAHASISFKDGLEP